MAGQVKLNCPSGGSVTLGANDSASNTTLTLPNTTDTVVTLAATQTLTNKTLTSPTIDGSPSITGYDRIVQGTAQTGNGTGALAWTGLPTWVKRITFNYTGIYNTSAGVAFNLLQIGSGSYTSSGYSSVYNNVTAANTVAVGRVTVGFIMSDGASSSYPISGMAILTLISNNTWVCNIQHQVDGLSVAEYSTGKVTLSGALDRIQLIPNGAYNILAGTANIIYEG